ncbi:hypothetical protein L1987_29380 [Smallanthus sonchifolius]|uniref:Uncharacterized protein n=1 Tax=Smallanthus sonchifolius TaxID=185202 RepID=A0ACB9I0K7_9ASTR|nr:hypothetical protein L1987_29380 [Smallanthus sonchifolius]
MHPSAETDYHAGGLLQRIPTPCDFLTRCCMQPLAGTATRRFGKTNVNFSKKKLIYPAICESFLLNENYILLFPESIFFQNLTFCF